MTAPVRIAVPRKGRPLEAVLDRLATVSGGETVADDVISTLRYEKAVTKGEQTADTTVYDRLARYSTLEDPYQPEYTLLRDDRDGKPRRIVFDSVTLDIEGVPVELVGREEPFRALRTHSFALGFDSADLVLEEVVSLEPEPLSELADLNDRIDPHDTDVRVVTGLGDTVYHTVLAKPSLLEGGPRDAPDRSFIAEYEGPLVISPRYERLVEAVLGTDATRGLTFEYPAPDEQEEPAIAGTGIGIYLTVTGGTARDTGLLVGEQLFPSETVLLENENEADDPDVETVKSAISLEDTLSTVPVA
ncbi:MAG: hypothetical protein ACQEQY_01885 [Halobacteriota archaeon]